MKPFAFLLAALLALVSVPSRADISTSIPGMQQPAPSAQQQQPQSHVPTPGEIRSGAEQTLSLQLAIGNVVEKLGRPGDPMKVLQVSISKSTGFMLVSFTSAKRGPVDIIFGLQEDGVSWMPEDLYLPFDMQKAIQKAKEILKPAKPQK